MLRHGKAEWGMGASDEERWGGDIVEWTEGGFYVGCCNAHHQKKLWNRPPVASFAGPSVSPPCYRLPTPPHARHVSVGQLLCHLGRVE